jgi:Zn-dependent protease
VKTSFHLFTFRNIAIRIDLSWLIIFFLVVYSLVAFYYPQETLYASWPLWEKLLVALVTSLIFFLSVLVHEMAHSIVAQSRGIAVPSITLFIFGGAAAIAEEPKKAMDEFLMASVGPITSLIIGGLFWLIYYFFGDLWTPLNAVCYWIAMVNILLAVFNLLPGFPLDGGRVLRSIVWGATKNLVKSTRVATYIGRGFGYLLIAFGVLLVFGGNWFNGVWMVFIGWFLENAASQSYRELALTLSLKGHKVSELMRKECPVVSPKLTVKELVEEQILPKGARCFPVIEGGKLLGIVTLQEVKHIAKEDWGKNTISDIMVPAEEVQSVKPSDSLALVMQKMLRANVNQLAVKEGDEFLGVVSRDGVLEFLGLLMELKK